ncbi:MAG: cadherin repeat domain-containing protein [Prolixibacteraceae bacterium]
MNKDYTINLPLEVDLKKYRNNDFKLNGSTLVTGKVFDYEKEQSIVIQLEVSNGISKITQDITLGVINQNDAPAEINISEQVLSESVAVNSVLATLSAVDQDQADTHVFKLILGNGINDEGNPWVKIEGNKLILVKPLDYETSGFHNILVRVSDSLGATFDQSIRLQVTNANDAPVFYRSEIKLRKMFRMNSSSYFRLTYQYARNKDYLNLLFLKVLI